MKAVMLMFDSLNRHFLPNYGCAWTHAPNFQRLAQRTATFDRSYVCSMPCMPARRELHTARPNFLDRNWGPLEPVDDSAIEMLKQAGVYTHLATDHYHYFEDGGCTYHNRYNTWEFFRGQEGDPWIGQVADPPIPRHINGKGRRQDWVNRQFMRAEREYSGPQTVRAGLEFLRRNRAADRWFLQIECFDPHEPFTSPRPYKDQYARHYDEYAGPLFDWPGYRAIQDETPQQIEHLRHEYASLLTMCDAMLGDVLDAMDEHDLWKDTLLVVWTDHGHMLGEHGMLAKNWMGWYEETAHTPLFVWDPRCPQAAGQRRSALVQPALDLPVTLLDYFGLQPAPDMLGRNLRDAMASDAAVRDAAIWGLHGSCVQVSDGRYVYFRWPVTQDNTPLCVYTTMPILGGNTIYRREPLKAAQLVEPRPWSKGCPVLRLGDPGQVGPRRQDADQRHRLYDLQTDPHQNTPLHDAALEARMCELMVRLMKECAAPAEQYVRLGLERYI